MIDHEVFKDVFGSMDGLETCVGIETKEQHRYLQLDHFGWKGDIYRKFRILLE